MNDKIKPAVKQIAESEGLHDYAFETVSGSSKGEGYLGLITTLKITGKNARDETQDLNCIVKSAYDNDTLRSELPIEHSYTTETRMYANVFPTLNKFQEEILSTPLAFAPKFYYASSKNGSETIILENLRELGYKLHPLDFSMNDTHVTLCLQHYAKFHALSFALQKKETSKFREITDGMKDGYFPFLMKTLEKSVVSVCQRSLSSLDAEANSEAYEKYNAFILNTDSFYEDIMNVDTNKYCVVLHGDCWTNNMMFNYQDDDNPNKPTSVRFLDFQMSRLGFPAIDVANFIYCNSSKDVLNNLDHYLEYYYRCFSKHLLKLGGDPDELYPFSVLKGHLEKYARFTLFLVPMLLQMGSSDQKIDLDIMAEQQDDIGGAFGAEIADKELFNSKIKHTILHFVEYKFL